MNGARGGRAARAKLPGRPVRAKPRSRIRPSPAAGPASGYCVLRSVGGTMPLGSIAPAMPSIRSNSPVGTGRQ